MLNASAPITPASCNPTGSVYSHDELKSIADVLAEHENIIIVSDEIYEHIYWGTSPLRNLLNICPDLRERFLLVNGVSKAYAMTGRRIGYTAAPAAIVKTMKKIQSQSTSNP